MRYRHAEEVLRLALELAGTRQGRTLDEMAVAIGVKRRTVERMRQTVEAVFGPLHHCNPGEKERRWRLHSRVLTAVVAPTAEEVAEVEFAARRLAEEGHAERTAALQRAAAKLRVAASDSALRRAEPDLELLLRAEGLAARPGPQAAPPEGVLPLLREAIVASGEIAVQYRSNLAKDARQHLLHPHGLLYGARSYLVAAKDGKPEPVVWRLDRIERAERTGKCFVPRADFDLAAFAARSFGVWQEEPVDVALRFAGEAAAEARAWRFHATQTVETCPDSSLVVRFRAGGRLEMCWHLLTWGENVEVLEPAALRRQLAEMAAAAADHHARAPTATAVPRRRATAPVP